MHFLMARRGGRGKGGEGRGKKMSEGNTLPAMEKDGPPTPFLALPIWENNIYRTFHIIHLCYVSFSSKWVPPVFLVCFPVYH